MSPLRGGVDRNNCTSISPKRSMRSPLRGGVDRNTAKKAGSRDWPSRPFAGAWIETPSLQGDGLAEKVAPSRGRGSKRHCTVEAADQRTRSPLRGGVDRNGMRRLSRHAPRSRPFAGAWIETPDSRQRLPQPIVAPSRGRGSKPQAQRGRTCRNPSPLRGGRGSKRGGALATAGAVQVAPSRGRGSKRARRRPAWRTPAVAPSRGRGSKPEYLRQHHAGRRRPFAGAWIETSQPPAPARTRPGRPFAGAWIETQEPRIGCPNVRSPLRGGVDRNKSTLPVWPPRRRRPFAGAWIETIHVLSCPRIRPVAPSRGRGSKRHHGAVVRTSRSSPLRGGVDRNGDTVGQRITEMASPLRGGVDRNML